ncbi:MAG: Phosphatidate cytidylyltransferase [Devosia sp.]|nr:Phosphatidate cytidylyltransferase [Devosia sp.]
MSSPGSPPRRNWSDLGPRLASAAVLLIVTVTVLFLGGWVFALIIGLVFAGCYREWEFMVARRPVDVLGYIQVALVVLSGLLYAFFGPWGTAVPILLACAIALARWGEGSLWRVWGLLLFGAVVFSLLALRGETPLGIWAGLYLGTVVWMTDSAAFFAGRQIGGEKLAPDISPSKTWSGALGGLFLGTLAGTVVWVLVTPSPWWVGVLLSAALSVVGQIGDLTESAVKRNWRIKDSGDLIPGHGGLMDRLDSMTFAAIALFLIGGLHGGFDAVAVGALIW